MTYLRLALGKIVNSVSSICIVLVRYFEENGVVRRLVRWFLLSGPGRTRAYSFPDCSSSFSSNPSSSTKIILISSGILFGF